MDSLSEFCCNANLNPQCEKVGTRHRALAPWQRELEGRKLPLGRARCRLDYHCCWLGQGVGAVLSVSGAKRSRRPARQPTAKLEVLFVEKSIAELGRAGRSEMLHQEPSAELGG